MRDKLEPCRSAQRTSVTKQLLDTEAIQSGGSCDASSCTKRLLHVLTLCNCNSRNNDMQLAQYVLYRCWVA